METEIVAYELEKSLDHLDDLPEDDQAWPYDAYTGSAYDELNSGKIPGGMLLNTTPYNGSEPVNMLGHLDRLTYQTELLYVDIEFDPILSKRMLYVLRSVGEFPHKAIPVHIYDESLYSDANRERIKHFLGREDIGSEYCNRDFVALQLLEHTDAIDRELTEYIPDPDNPDWPPDLKRLVLKEPSSGFPPMFRVQGERFPLYVSPSAKQALEEAGIRGLKFIPQEGVRT
jgi:hypothetical protein